MDAGNGSKGVSCLLLDLDAAHDEAVFHFDLDEPLHVHFDLLSCVRECTDIELGLFGHLRFHRVIMAYGR